MPLHHAPDNPSGTAPPQKGPASKLGCLMICLHLTMEATEQISRVGHFDVASSPFKCHFGAFMHACILRRNPLEWKGLSIIIGRNANALLVGMFVGCQSAGRPAWKLHVIQEFLGQGTLES